MAEPKVKREGFRGVKEEPETGAKMMSVKKEETASGGGTELLKVGKTGVKLVKTETTSDIEKEYLAEGGTDIESRMVTLCKELTKLVENDVVILSQLKDIMEEQSDIQNDEHYEAFTLYKLKELLIYRRDYLATADRFKKSSSYSTTVSGIDRALEVLERHLKQTIKGYQSSTGQKNIPGCYRIHLTEDANCWTCKTMQLGRTTRTTFSSLAGKEFTINKELSCNSTNVVYVLTCRNCSKQYVGSTEFKLSLRMLDHKRNVKENKKGSKLVKHFNNLSDCKEYEVIVIDKFEPEDSPKDCEDLLDLEQMWMDKLDTLNNGLNDRRSKRQRKKGGES